MDRELKKEMKEEGDADPEDEAFLDRIVDHSQVSKYEIIQAAEALHQEAHNLEHGNYEIMQVVNLFVDCFNRNRKAKQEEPDQDIKPENTALMHAIKSTTTAPRQIALHKERNAMHLRVVDPFGDPHVWAIIDEGCNSVCHGQ